MRICVLGISAGGGLPQWNCRCENCLDARGRGDERFHHSHASIAVSGSGKSWCLINPTPDITNQIERFKCLHPKSGIRSSPIPSVFLTDGELDHTLGLLPLRQGARFDIYAPKVVAEILSNDFPVRRVVNSYAEHRWKTIAGGQRIHLEREGLRISVISAGTKLPRYVAGQKSGIDATVAYYIEDIKSGSSLLYAPSLQKWTEAIDDAAKKAHCVMIDGTFWKDDELIAYGITDRSGIDMGHLPLAGEDGILENLANSPAQIKYLVHVNNTNRILLRSSNESKMLSEHKVSLAPERSEIVI